MTQTQIRGDTGALGSGGSLDVFDVPGSVILTPFAVSATFDGSGAGGAFLPCLTLKTQTGAIIARCPAPQVAAGASAEVSWFPHVAQQVSGGGGSGIQYDVCNTGDWLDVQATGQDSGACVPDFGGSSIGFLGTFGSNYYDHEFINIQVLDDNNAGLIEEVKGVSNAGVIRQVFGSGNAGITDLVENTGNAGWSARVGGDNNSGITLATSGTANDGITLDAGTGAGIFLKDLPTVAPGGSHQLWNNAGVINITP